jgi:hypothetical protein
VEKAERKVWEVVVSEKQFYEIARRVERDFEPQFGPDVSSEPLGGG